MTGLSAFAVTSLARAQQPSGVPRVALVEYGDPVERIAVGGAPIWDALLTELRRLGRIEGETIAIERWSLTGENRVDASLATEIAASGPDVIVARGNPGGELLAAATTSIPIVYAGTLEHLVGELGRPAANLTGVNFPNEIWTKHLQLLQQVAPTAAPTGWLGTKAFWTTPQAEEVRAGAARLGLTVVPHFVATPVDEQAIATAFAGISSARLGSLLVGGSPDMRSHGATIARLAIAAGLPTLALQPQYAEAGLLMAYGPNLEDAYRRLAGYVDQLLDGVPPADLPIEQPTLFDLVINLRTAAALGLTMPPEIMIMATEVIE